MIRKNVEGEDRGDVLLYALSTCIWCRKTKQLLDKLGVAYSYIDVDRLEGETKQCVVDELGRWNERRSYPTIVIGGTTCIVSYDEDKIRKALGK